jgi:Mce-associated membrane protein
VTDENINSDAEVVAEPDTIIEPEPEVEADVEADVDADDEADTEVAQPDTAASLNRDGWLRPLTLGVLPALIVVLGAGAGFLAWTDRSNRAVEAARVESVAAAGDATVAILSYKPDTVEQDLRSASDRLTGSFLDSFTDLVNKVVIPGAREKKIAAAAQVSAAASVSASANHAVALVFVNQTVTIEGGAPSGTASSVRVTLDKVDDRWLVSGFDPV